jgi:hypothetical protein
VSIDGGHIQLIRLSRRAIGPHRRYLLVADARGATDSVTHSSQWRARPLVAMTIDVPKIDINQNFRRHVPFSVAFHRQVVNNPPPSAFENADLI